MQWKNVFAILEIEPTNDKKEIKKAYAKLVKKYHPEEYPEKWKEIHDAYEMALQFAENKEKPPVPITKTDTTERQKTNFYYFSRFRCGDKNFSQMWS